MIKHAGDLRAHLPPKWPKFESWPDVKFGSSLLLVLVPAPRVFPWFPPSKRAIIQISNLIFDVRTLSNELVGALPCNVGKWVPFTFSYICKCFFTCVTRTTFLFHTFQRSGHLIIIEGEQARVRFRPGTICGLSLLLVLVLAPRFFLRVLRFSLPHKNQHFQISIRSGISGIKTSHLVEGPTVNSHLFYYYLLFYYCRKVNKCKENCQFTTSVDTHASYTKY